MIKYLSMTIIIIDKQWYIITIIINLKRLYQLTQIANQWTHLLTFFIFINYILSLIYFNLNWSDVTSTLSL